jgi:hypothetical protein
MKYTFSLAILFLFALSLPLSVVGAQSAQQEVEKRLKSAVEERKITLTQEDKQDIQKKCKASQEIIRESQTDANRAVSKRTEIYQDLKKELQALSLRFSRQAVDASELDLLVGKLTQGLDSFNQKSDTLNGAYQDALIINCKNKPEEFKAAVIILRAQHSYVYEESQDLRALFANAKTNTYPQLKERLTVQ